MPESVPIQVAVGAFVAEVRREHGATLDQVARFGRLYGATWSASSIANVERGQASMTLTTMLQLALALGDVAGRPFALSDLLGDADVLALGRHELNRSWFDRMLAGEPLSVSPDDDPAFAVPTESRASEKSIDQGRLVEALLDASREPAERPSRDGSLAETRAAGRLGIAVDELQALAQRLWGDSLEAESARRAGPASTPQARGRATRLLVDELRRELDAGRAEQAERP